MNWTKKHQNWAMLLWVILAPAMCMAIFSILYFVFSYNSPSLLTPLGTIILGTAMILTTVASVVVVLVYFYRKSKHTRGLEVKETESLAKTEKEKYELPAKELQEKEYRHIVWEKYREEWETASPEKRDELNKRMLRWQELMKGGLPAGQAYIRVILEELDETPWPILGEKTDKE